MRHDFFNFGRGLLMGGADIIPGVSGGTVALVVGIYERLVTAISHFDLQLLKHVSQRQWRSAAAHVDLRFLLALGAGIILGILTFGSLMNQLLTTEATRSLTLAGFFGAILASCVIVFRIVQWKSSAELGFYLFLEIAAMAIAFGLTRISVRTGEEPALWYIFSCGVVAICAMILPGISGAFILLILGVYVHLTDYIRGIPRGEISPETVTTIAVFATGCAIGLISFSKVLRWLLGHHQSATMAVMCGLMLGALNKIWPFQNDMTPEIHNLKHKAYANYIPQVIDTEVIQCFIVAMLAGSAVLVLDRFVKQTAAENPN